MAEEVRSCIHLVKHVIKPKIRFACDEEWEGPEPEHLHSTSMVDVYKTNDGRFYTFEPRLVTCPKCKG